jgi:hypothetical protein
MSEFSRILQPEDLVQPAPEPQKPRRPGRPAKTEGVSQGKRYMGRTPEKIVDLGPTVELSETRPWEQIFLERFSTEGGKTLSAKEAGVTWPQVRKRIESDPVFAAAFEEAQEQYRDKIERDILALGNGTKKGAPISYIFRLKGERPEKYQDKLQVAGAVAHLHAAPPIEELRSLLAAMLRDAMPETKALIAGEVIEARQE